MSEYLVCLLLWFEPLLPVEEEFSAPGVVGYRHFAVVDTVGGMAEPVGQLPPGGVSAVGGIAAVEGIPPDVVLPGVLVGMVAAEGKFPEVVYPGAVGGMAAEVGVLHPGEDLGWCLGVQNREVGHLLLDCG